MHNIKFLRALVLPILKTLDRDITIKHHWTGDPITLSLFAHKGYWFHGKERESFEMSTIQSLLSPGDIVAEVGGHIGYLSLHFAQCVQAGTDGRVFVFEPGINNLPYLRKNLSGKEGIEIIEAGCGETNGKLDFYMDDLTGQNNSFVQDFEGLEKNSKFAPGVKVTVSSLPVEVLRLDSFFSDKQNPDFIKIDTEGFELSVLKGCSGLFDGISLPIFMIEVQTDQDIIFDIFSKAGYRVFNRYKNEVDSPGKMRESLYFFAFHQAAHQEKLQQWLDA